MEKIYLPEFGQLQKQYSEFAKIYFRNMEHLYGPGSISNAMLLKEKHGLSMSQLVPELTQQSELFNSSYLDSAAIDGLLHDVGRFPQYILTKTLADNVLKEQYGYADHGRLGEHILEDHILVSNFQLKDYLFILKVVVGNHTQIYNPKYNRSLSDLPATFQNYSFDEIVTNEELRDWVIAAKIAFVVEADDFEIIQNIINRDWRPLITEKKEDRITDKVWELFTNNQPINMNELKQEGNWTCNSGFALRNGLIPQKAQLRATLETLLEKGYLEVVYARAVEGQEHPDPRIHECYLYTRLLVENMIHSSDKIITPEQRNEGVQLTKKMWNRL